MTKTGPHLLVVHGLAQAEDAASREPAATIFTLDLAAAAVLESKARPFVDGWQYLDEAQLERSWHASFELSERWWGGGPSLKHRGVDVSVAAIGEWRITFEHVLKVQAVFERCFDGVRPSVVSAYVEPAQAVCRHGPPPLARAIHSLSLAVLRWVLDARGISFRELPAPAEPQALRTPRRSQRGAVAHVTGPEVRPAVQTERTVLLLDLGQNPKDVVSLERAFEQQPGWRVERMSEFTRPGYPRWFAPDEELQRCARTQWTALVERRRAWTGDVPVVFANPYLDFQFERIWAEQLRAIEHADAVDAIVDVTKPSIVVLGVDNFTLERLVLDRLRARGVPNAVLLHGGLGPSRAFRELASQADWLLVWGDEDVETLARYGTPPERMIPCGSLRYDDAWCSLGPVSARRPKVASVDAEFPNGPVVAVLTAVTSLGLGVPLADARAHRRALEALIELSARRREVTFVLKPHPTYDHFELYEVLARRAPPNFLYRREQDLTALLCAADATIVVNNATTAALEACLHEVPVLFLNNAVFNLSDWQRSSLSEHGAVRVSALEDLPQLLERVLTDEGFRLEVLRDARVFLHHKLGPPHAGAVARRAAEALVERAGQLPRLEATPFDSFFWKLRAAPQTVTPTEIQMFARSSAQRGQREQRALLFGVAHVLAVGEGRRRLREHAQRLTKELHVAGLAPEVIEMTKSSVFLSAMIDATNRGDWGRVERTFASFARSGLTRSSVELALRLVGKAFATHSELAATGAGLVERAKSRLEHMLARRR